VPLGSYVENVALATVKLQGFKLSTFWDRIFVLVVWSGVPVVFAQSGKIVEQKRVSQVRRDVITVAAQILLADGKTAIEELKLLEKIAASHHMKQEEVNSIIYGLQNGEVYIPAPFNSKESWSLLQSAARMALCDNELSPEEEKCLDALA